MDNNDYNILLTGNGFDIALGYRTRYEDFMTFVKATQKQKSFEEFSSFVKLKWEIPLLDEDTAKSFYNKLKARISHNFIINYFLNYYITTLSWADFEAEIMHIGLSLESIISALNDDRTNFIGEHIAELPFSNELKKYSYYLLFFNNNEIFSIDFDNIYAQNDRDLAMLSIVDKDIKEKCNNTRARFLRLIELLPNMYYKKLLEFSELFELYLQIESKRTVKIHQSKYKISNVITYNYTHNCEYLCSNIFYVNGKISSNKISNNIIFGVDSGTSFNTTIFRGVTKEIQRAAHGIKPSSITAICRGVKTLYIFGYSLTTADKDTLRLVFNQIKIRGALSRIIIFYKSTGNINNDLLTKISLSNNLKTILDEDYSKIIDLIDFQESEDFFLNSN